MASTLNLDDPLSYLVSMGFDPESASTALSVCDGNVDNAVNFLLTEDDAPQAPQPSPPLELSTTTATAGATLTSAQHNGASEVRVGSKSQYSYDNGHSACTCIALEAAQGLLTTDESSSDAFVNVTPSFLDRMVEQGVRRYEAAARNRSLSSSAADHTSVEDVLPQFAHLHLRGETRQGLLSRDPSHPLGLRSLLRSCCSELLGSDGNSAPWICAVLTKPPETILLCLSPDSYVLVDSHPRPQLLPQANQAYAVRHATLDDLIKTVERVFPAVDLGDDVPELMQAMYNSFDLSVVASGNAATTG